MYDYQGALRGDGLAAPSPQPTTASSALIGSSTTESGAVEAYRKENESLKEMIEIVSKQQGSNGILEGKYLAQIKKCKTLTVQLESEKTHARQLQKDLDAAVAKASQDDEARKAPARPGKKGKSAAPGAESAETGHGDGDGDATVAAATEVKSLKERLERAFQQVRGKDILMEEMKRENTQLRQLVRQEIGDLDNKEVDALLKRTGSVLDASSVGTASSSPAGNSGHGGGGGGATGIGAWKGRAEQIALLKAKNKDLERELSATQGALQHAASAAIAAASAGAVPDQIRDDGTSSAAFLLGGTNTPQNSAFDQTDVASWLSLAQKTNGGGGGAVETASHAAGAKDFEAEERRHLSDLANQKLMRIRELEQQLDAATRSVSEEKRKQTALQARYQTLQRQHTQLRAHVETMLEKSATDDELIAAYKEEMEAAQQAKRAMEYELVQYREQEWQQAAGGSHTSGTGAHSGVLQSRSQGESKPAAAATANASTRTVSSSSSPGALPNDGDAGAGDPDVAQLRQLVVFYKSETAVLREQLAAARTAAAAGQSATSSAPSSLLTTLNAWWAQALASPPVVAALRRSATTTSSAADDDGLLSAVMAVLLVAHRHVVETETHQAALVDGPASTLLGVLEQYELTAHKLQRALTASTAGPLSKDVLESVLASLQSVASRSGASGAMTQAEFARKENAHLRDRTRVLTEMLEKERQALIVAHREELKQLAQREAQAYETGGALGHERTDTLPQDEAGAESEAAAAKKEMAEQYATLQRQYNDLRKAFNQMQSQSMKGA